MANKEEPWVEEIKNILNEHFEGSNYHAEVQVGLPYEMSITGFKIVEAGNKKHCNPQYSNEDAFTTDLLIYEDAPDGTITPRVVIEAKINDATTHDVITYAEKAIKHRALMPALRYGLMIGANNSESLTWKHFAHGNEFDFMFSFKSEEPNAAEKEKFLEIVDAEIKCSQDFEDMSKSKNKNLGICCVHRKLEVAYTKN